MASQQNSVEFAAHKKEEIIPRNVERRSADFIFGQCDNDNGKQYTNTCA